MLNCPSSMYQHCSVSNTTWVHLSPTMDMSNIGESGRKKEWLLIKREKPHQTTKRMKKKMIAKKNKKNNNGNSKGGSNRFWNDPRYNDVLIPYLAKLAKEGHKANKTFKKTGFSSNLYR